MQVPTQHHTATTPPRRRRAWAFTAAFALIVATIGIAAMALRSDSTAGTDGTETPEIESLQWPDVGLESILDATQVVGDVTVGQAGLVAVGHQFDNAAVWTSSDGLHWSQVPYQDSFWQAG